MCALHTEIAAFLTEDDLAVRADAAAASALAAGAAGTGAAASLAAAAYAQHGGASVGGALLVTTNEACIYKLALTSQEVPGMATDVRELEGGFVAVRVALAVPTVVTCVVSAADWARVHGK